MKVSAATVQIEDLKGICFSPASRIILIESRILKIRLESLKDSFSPASRIILIERAGVLAAVGVPLVGFSPASRIILIESANVSKFIVNLISKVSVPQAGLF